MNRRPTTPTDVITLDNVIVRPYGHATARDVIHPRYLNRMNTMIFVTTLPLGESGSRFKKAH